MKRLTIQKLLSRVLRIAPLFLFLVTCGCRTTSNPLRGTAPSDSLLESVLAEAQDPRKYWLKIYRGEDGPIFEDAHRLHANQHATASFVTNKRLNAPMIMGMVRKKDPQPALIDTLSEHNWMDFHHAMELNAIPLGPKPYGVRPRHVLDTMDSFVGLMPTFRIDQLHVESLVVNIRPINMDLGPLGRGIEDPHPVFILGQDFIKPFSFIRIDFPLRSISFSVSKPYEPDPFKLLAARPFQYGKRGITIQGTLYNYEGAIAIDLAGNYMLAIPYPEELVEKQLTLGSFVSRQIPVHNSLDLGFSASSLPSLGNAMFKDLILTIDNHKNMIYLEKPPLR